MNNKIDTVKFDEVKHEYSVNNDVYISTTQLLQKYNLSVDYGNIPPDVLAKAAERGTAVHKNLEDRVNGSTTLIGTDAEVTLFNDYITIHGIDLLTAKSEQIVYDTKYHVAGTVDFQYLDAGGYVIADFKTTSTLHLDAVAWQLSIYNYLISQGDIMMYYFNKLKVYHFTRGKLYVRDVYTVDYDAVEGLLKAHQKGDPTYTYVKTVKVMSDGDKILLDQLTDEISMYKENITRLEQELNRILDSVKKNMIDKKDYSTTTNKNKLTYILPRARCTLNADKVKEYLTSQGENLNDYYNESTIKDSVRVTKLKAPYSF